MDWEQPDKLKLAGVTMDNKYDRIVNMPHPVSSTRPRMSLSRRAAQFAPFAALTGYDEVIRETARQTQAPVFLDEGEIAAIDRCLRRLKEEISRHPAVFVRFFQPDSRKEGGSFETRRDSVVKIDETLQKMTLQSGENIQFQHILQLIIE